MCKCMSGRILTFGRFERRFERPHVALKSLDETKIRESPAFPTFLFNQNGMIYGVTIQVRRFVKGCVEVVNDVISGIDYGGFSFHLGYVWGQHDRQNKRDTRTFGTTIDVKIIHLKMIPRIHASWT